MHGQDIHFSQFQQTPLLVNPSLTGQQVKTFRFGINYRDQWKNFDAPFKSVSGFFDGKIENNLIRNNGCDIAKDFFGYGILFFSDKAGDGNLTTTSLMLSAAYNKQLSNTLNVSLGFAFGLGNRKIDLENLTFLSQWDGTDFNNSTPEYLDQLNSSFYYFDFSSGIFISDSIASGARVFFGTSLQHINKPRDRFLSNNSSLERKLNFHAGIEFGNSSLKNTLSMYYSQQDVYNELIVFDEIDVFTPNHNVKLKESRVEKYNANLSQYSYNIIGGIGLRLIPVRDVFPFIGLETKKIKSILSYDISIISKNIPHPYNGGFELSIILKL